MINATIPQKMSFHNTRAACFIEFELLTHNTAEVAVYFEGDEGENTGELAEQYKGDIMEALSFYYEIYHEDEAI